MSAIPAALLSSAAPAARAGDTQSAAPDESVQPFEGVLAREIGRQENGKMPPGETTTAKEPVAGEPEPVASASDQQVAASPWLLMLQQFGSSLPVEPYNASQLTEAPGDETAESDAGQPNALLQWVQQSLAVTPAVVADGQSPEAAIVAEQSGLPKVAIEQSMPQLAANVSIGIGKELPQGLAKVGEQSGFADEFGDLLNRAGDAQSQQLLQAAVAKVEQGSTVTHSEIGQHFVSEPVGDARWGEVVAQRVNLMLGRQEQQMQMQLNPPHLGPMEVQLTLGSDQASVVFTSQHAAVREALAAATPRLTALLADQGIQLVNVQVASDSLQQQAQQQSRNQAALPGRNGGTGEFFGQLPDSVVEKRSLTGVGLQVARSGVSLYV